MIKHFKNDLPALLLTLLVSASTLTALLQVESVRTRVKEVYEEQDFGLHILRKAMLVALVSQHGTETPTPIGLNDQLSVGGRLVWKTQGPSISSDWGINKKDRRQGKA